MKDGKVIEKNYGSIPHLSTSKLTQQADKKIEMGQEIILTKKVRDWNDLIVVTEKLDGSNVGIINDNGNKIAITRSGYLAITSPYIQHILFNKWVLHYSYMFTWLPLNWRICGEWMAQSHGTIYDISGLSPFVAFDIFDNYNKRISYIEFIKICAEYKITTVPLLHIGQPVSIDNAKKILNKGHYGITDSPEGFVYRVERNGVVDFLAKWVRGDKEDGKYMEQEIWNKGFII